MCLVVQIERWLMAAAIGLVTEGIKANYNSGVGGGGLVPLIRSDVEARTSLGRQVFLCLCITRQEFETKPGKISYHVDEQLGSHQLYL